MHARVTRRMASVGSTRVGSGTFSTRTSPGPYISVALIHSTEAGRDAVCPTLLFQVPAGPLSADDAALRSPRGRQERVARVPHLEAGEDHAGAGEPPDLRRQPACAGSPPRGGGAARR